MLILGQKSCFLEPAIFKIPQVHKESMNQGSNIKSSGR